MSTTNEPVVELVEGAESDLISLDELIAKQNNPNNGDTPGDPEFQHMTREQLEQALKDAEAKRRGFQSDADRAKAEAIALRQVYETQRAEAVVHQAKATVEVEPKPEEFLKGVDPDDLHAVIAANSKYLEARQNYLVKQQTVALKEEFRREAEQAKVLEQARALATKDARFRLPDGGPNLKAIEEFLSSATSDWSALYDKIYAQQHQAQVSGDLVAPKSGFPKTLAGVGSAATPKAPKLPAELARVQSMFGKLDLPPGAYIKKK